MTQPSRTPAPRAIAMALLAAAAALSGCTAPGGARAGRTPATDGAAPAEPDGAAAPGKAEKAPKPRGRDPLSLRTPEPPAPDPVEALADARGEVPPDGLPPTAKIVARRDAPEDPSVRAPCKVEDDGEAALAEKFATAQDAMAAGQDELALDVVNGVLALEPKDPWLGRFRGLRQEIKSRHIETDVVRIDARGVREYVPFETDVDLVVRIRNVGTADVVILPPQGEGPEAVSGSALVLKIRRSDRDVYAAELTRFWTQSVPLLAQGQCELRIPPEGVHEVRVRVTAEDAGPPIAGLRVLEVGGDLRAGRILAGIGEPFGGIPIRTGRVVILPRNFEPLAADPVGSLKKAAAANAPIHLLVATEFVAPADRPAAMAILAEALATSSVDLRAAVLNAIHLLRHAAIGAPLRPLAEPLMASLRAHPDRARDLMEGLRAMTGVSLAADARLWEDWWRRELAGTPGRVQSDEDLAAPRASRPRR